METKPNQFLETLAELNEGADVAELDRELRDLVSTTRRTGKRGTLSFTLTVEPRGADMVVLTGKVTQKLPADEPFKSMFYVGEGGVLLRHNPNQGVLPFNESKIANS